MRIAEDWLLTPERAAIHLPTRTTVVADLHLGYDLVRRRAGEAIPARSLEAELAPLLRVMQREEALGLVIAGDLFEDGRLSETISADLADWLRLHRVTPVAFVPGNHDRGVTEAGLFPVRSQGVELGEWLVVHGDKPVPAKRVVQGHEHPWLRIHGVEAPCFLVTQEHLVLPAYSHDAAGVSVLGQERWAQHRCCAIAGERVLDFGHVGSLGERLRGRRASRL